MRRVASIDCGTNSIRLLIAELSADSGAGDAGSTVLRDLHREMRIVRLGQGVDATGRLSSDALERCRRALVDYAETAREFGVSTIRMVATSATRDAANRDRFFDMTRAVLGVEAEVITGEEEARLSFVGGVGEQDPADGPFLVVDVGGGSTELVLGTWDGHTPTIMASSSVDVGSVRITERALRDDPPTDREVEAARGFARETLNAAFETVDVTRAKTWIGLAGTITTMSALAQRLPAYDADRTHLSRLEPAEIADVAETLLRSDHVTRARNPVIHPGRVDVIGGGALVVRVMSECLAELGGPSSLLVSEHDILDGIALSLA